MRRRGSSNPFRHVHLLATALLFALPADYSCPTFPESTMRKTLLVAALFAFAGSAFAAPVT